MVRQKQSDSCLYSTPTAGFWKARDCDWPGPMPVAVPCDAMPPIQHSTSNVGQKGKPSRLVARLFSRNGTRQHAQKRWPTPKPSGKKTKELARKLRFCGDDERTHLPAKTHTGRGRRTSRPPEIGR